MHHVHSDPISDSLVLSMPTAQMVISDPQNDNQEDGNHEASLKSVQRAEQLHVQIDLHPVTARVQASHADVLVAILQRFGERASSASSSPAPSGPSGTTSSAIVPEIWLQVMIPRIDVTLETRPRQSSTGHSIEDRLQMLIEDSVVTAHHTRSTFGFQLKLGDTHVAHSVRNHGSPTVRGVPSWRPSIGDGRLLVVEGMEDATGQGNTSGTSAALFLSITSPRDRGGSPPSVRISVAPIHSILWWPCIQNVVDMFAGLVRNQQTSEDSYADDLEPETERVTYGFPKIRCEMRKIRVTIPIDEHAVGFDMHGHAGNDDVVVLQLASLRLKPEVDSRRRKPTVPTPVQSSDCDSESHASFGLRDLPADFQLTAAVGKYLIKVTICTYTHNDHPYR